MSTSLPATPLRQLVPGRLLELASRESREDFARLCGTRYVVVIRLDGVGGELAAGLALAFGAGVSVDAELKVLDFHTQLGDPLDFITSSGNLRATDFDPLVLRRFVSAGPCFAAPLVKRANAGTLSEQITVGRARNKDLVLRAPGVSKLHAYFAADGDDLTLTDAGSRNGTVVRGERLAPRIAERVFYGDLLNLGGVDMMLVAPEHFFNLVRG